MASTVYKMVTARIVQLLEQGTAPWRQPWDARVGLPLSMSTGRAYRGVNTFLLAVTGQAAGYSSPWWGTYRQIAERGGHVRKGEHSTSVILWSKVAPKHHENTSAQDDSGRPREHMILRYFNVFNADQAYGLSGLKPVGEERHHHDPIAECEQVIAGYLATGPTLQHGGNQASYSRAADRIRMPDRNAFETVEEYYSTLLHEGTHSTGHPSRLAREGIIEGHRFGDPCYAREELIAEMGAAMCCGVLAIDQVTLPASAAYLAGWMAALRGDTTMVIKAAAAAQRAADMILCTTPQDSANQTEVVA